MPPVTDSPPQHDAAYSTRDPTPSPIVARSVSDSPGICTSAANGDVVVLGHVHVGGATNDHPDAVHVPVAGGAASPAVHANVTVAEPPTAVGGTEALTTPPPATIAAVHTHDPGGDVDHPHPPPDWHTATPLVNPDAVSAPHASVTLHEPPAASPTHAEVSSTPPPHADANVGHTQANDPVSVPVAHDSAVGGVASIPDTHAGTHVPPDASDPDPQAVESATAGSAHGDGWHVGAVPLHPPSAPHENGALDPTASYPAWHPTATVHDAPTATAPHPEVLTLAASATLSAGSAAHWQWPDGVPLQLPSAAHVYDAVPLPPASDSPEPQTVCTVHDAPTTSGYAHVGPTEYDAPRLGLSDSAVAHAQLDVTPDHVPVAVHVHIVDASVGESPGVHDAVTKHVLPTVAAAQPPPTMYVATAVLLSKSGGQ